MVYLDELSLISLPQILLYALGHRVRTGTVLHCRYFTATPKGKKLLGLLQRLGLLSGEEADYTYEDVLDENGGLLILRAREMDSLKICEAVRSADFERNPNIGKFTQWFDRERIYMYLEKSLDDEIRTDLIYINLASWFQRQQEAANGASGVLFLQRSLWLRHLQSYAATFGVELRGYWTRNYSYQMPVLPWMRSLRLVGPLGRSLFRTLRARLTSSSAGPRSQPQQVSGETNLRVTVLAPYWGRGVTLDQSHNSDLFWVPYAELSPDQLLVYATRGDVPLDEAKYSTLRQSSIRAIAVTKAAKATPSLPSWPRREHFPKLMAEIGPVWKLLLSALLKSLFARGLNRWIGQSLLRFVATYVYWRWFFTSNNVKLFVDHIDWARGRLAADQAIADLGGLSVSFQRTFDPFSAVCFSSAVDVRFAFSAAWAETVRGCGSRIAQHVSNGYVHDFAFPNVGERAAEVRRKLEQHGARFVICLLDENSLADKRQGPSHPMRAENYRFLLEKFLADPTLGLVIKPKKPNDLRERLGPVADLLDAALATGRCHLYEGGIMASDTLPSEASMAADITIGLLYGSTAALESALSGTPTLLVDREFLTYHPLYALGEGKVVFRQWPKLWQALSAYREDPASQPGLGDWWPLLGTLDSFRDGKAGQRMGKYIGWLAEGLGQGMTRDEAMELARQRYVKLWGVDKVLDLRTETVPAS